MKRTEAGQNIVVLKVISKFGLKGKAWFSWRG